MFKLYSIVVLLVVGTTCGFAASFDCTKAGTWVENAICDNSSLSRLDSRLGERYIRLRNETKEMDSYILKGLVDGQKAWLKRRNRCTNVTCLNERYRERLDELDRLEEGL